MPKVLVIVPYPLSEQGVANRRSQLAAVNGLEGLEFEYRPVKVAPALGAGYHDLALFEIAIFEAGCTAEEDGFDAVCIDTMSDSGMKPLRAALTIPVISPALASYHMALTLGSRFSVLTQWDPWVRETYDQIEQYGLSHRCASVRTIGVPPDPTDLLGGKPEIVEALLVEARRCVDDGADVLCLGSTTMHQSHAHLAKHLPIPVINPGPLTYALAKLMLGLGLTHSKRAFPRPTEVESGVLHAMLSAGAEWRAQVPSDGAAS
jgi:allantoin racemase